MMRWSLLDINCDSGWRGNSRRVLEQNAMDWFICPFLPASNYGPCPLKRQRQIGQAFSEWTVERRIFCQKKSNASQFQKPFGSLKQCIPTNNQPLSWSPEVFSEYIVSPKMWPSPTPLNSLGHKREWILQTPATFNAWATGKAIDLFWNALLDMASLKLNIQ